VAKRQRKRPNGEGSLYFRASDRRWVAAYRGQVKTHKTRERAAQLLDQMKLAALQGYNHRAARSAANTVESLSELLFHSGLAKSTTVQYRSGLKHLLPYLGGRSVAELTPITVRTWLRSLDEKYGATKARTRQVAFDCLVRLLKIAKRDGLIATLPTEGIPRPIARRKPINPPTLDEAVRIIAAAPTGRIRVAIALGLWAALRPCEIFGLRWSRVDFRRSVLLVDQAAVESGSVTLQDHSKTAAAHREVPMIPQLIELLKSHQTEAIFGGQLDVTGQTPESLVICSRDGKPISRSNFLYKYWKPLLAELGLTARPFYSTRHSCATMLVASGIPMQVVAKIVGHSDPRVTMSTYSHVLPGDAEKAAAALSQLYQSAKPPEG